jgi:hypothetical protein
LDDESFEQILLDSIDNALLNLGETCRNVLYTYLGSALSLKKYMIPKKLEEFTGAMNGVFRSGTKVIEGLIIRALCEKLDANWESVKNKGLVSAIKEIKDMAMDL